MTRSKKFSALAAVLAIAFISIYASVPVFNSTNQLQTQITYTLNLQGGGQIPVTIAPGQTLPTQLNGDNVVGLTFNGQYDPAGANAVMQAPDGSKVVQMWQMAGGTAIGCTSEPETGTMS